MPRICYVKKRFHKNSLAVISDANDLIDSYREDGFDLTLRQLYYRFVALDLFPDDRRWSMLGGKWTRDPNGTKNADPNYKWLGKKINDARLAGLMDWDIIVDRTREVVSHPHWDRPSEIVEDCVDWFRVDSRATQDYYFEVWIEKEALIGVVEDVCSPLDVPCFACRGYVSQSAMWRAAIRRFQQADEEGFETLIFYLGDHDPSGVDMPRDIQARMKMFGSDVGVVPLALTMAQINELNPPSDPAKPLDSRSPTYVREFGNKSWELDALEPAYITNLIETAIGDHTDEKEIAKQKKIQAAQRSILKKAANNLFLENH